jgi:hypothetical protein
VISKEQALREVSGWLAISLDRNPYDLEAGAGVTAEQQFALSPRERDNYEWAMAEVASRLRRMGRPRRKTETGSA